MNKYSILRKTLSLITGAALSVALLSSYPELMKKNNKAHARTLAEIQQEREETQQKIDELQVQLDSLAGDIANEEAYQSTLLEQADLIRQKINSINIEIEAIGEDVTATQNNIERLDASIADQQGEIDRKVADFKERLYSMYVSGNSNLAAVLLGSSSFYDTIVNIEMVNRIASYDEQLINQLLKDIEDLEHAKQDLNTEKLNLEMKQDDLEHRKNEKQSELEKYNDKMSQTQLIIDRLASEKQMMDNDRAKLEADLDAYDAEAAEIEAQIRRAQEEAQRRYEEEQRRIAQQNAANNGYNYDANTYTVPSPSAAGFTWPAPGYCYISSPYGWRWGRLHAGIDIGDAGIGGGTAVAARSGTVISVYNSCTDDYPKTYSCGCNGGYGNSVVISHDGTYSTLYGHLRYATVSVGQYVEAGQQIGVIGCTGHSTGDHLHFEVWVNGVRQDPLGYVYP
jgi:murein DD-endopeptidase MepM/ murein hydrolase activator NlpD